MATARVTRRFDAPLERVWALGSDIAGWPRWHKSIIEVSDVSGPGDRVGTTAKLRMRGPDRVHDLDLEVTSVEPQRLRVQVAREAGDGLLVTTTIRLMPVADGTEFSWEQVIKPAPGLVNGLIDRLLLRRMSEREMRKACENIAGLLRESRATEAV